MAEDHDAELISRLRKVIEGQGLSLAAMGKELRERHEQLVAARAKINRLRVVVEFVAENDWAWKGGGSEVRMPGRFAKIARSALELDEAETEVRALAAKPGSAG